MNTKIDVNGTPVSIFEAHTDEGLWDTEKYGEMKEWYSKDTGEQTAWNKFKSKVIRINTIIHGNVDKNSPKLMNKFILGRLLGQFRASWLPEGWYNRFGTERYDEELERTIKGRYKTMGDLNWGGSMLVMGRMFLNLIPGVNTDVAKGVRFVKKTKDGAADSQEIVYLKDSAVDMDNMRRNFREFMFYLTMSAAIMSLKYMGDDDEEDPKKKMALQFLINLLIRSKQDIELYATPGVFNAVLRNPIPAADVIIDYSKLIKATGKYIVDEDYEFQQWLLKFTKAGLPIPQATQINKWNYMLSRSLDEFQ